MTPSASNRIAGAPPSPPLLRLRWEGRTHLPCNHSTLSFRAPRGIPALLKYFMQPQRQFNRLRLPWKRSPLEAI